MPAGVRALNLGILLPRRLLGVLRLLDRMLLGRDLGVPGCGLARRPVARLRIVGPRDEENAAVFTDDRGFRTGDLGYLDDDGFLYITGRIKEQYKLENGKYVSPAPLEEPEIVTEALLRWLS